MAELSREFGISRKSGCKIFERYQECGVQGRTDVAPFPRPLNLLGDARTLLENGKCSQSFCDSLGGHLKDREQPENSLPNTVYYRHV